MKIAYISSRVTLPGSPTRRSDAFEHDYMMDALRPPFAALGMSLHDLAWDDPDLDWSSFGAAIIGTTWDYWDRIDEFLATLERIGTLTKLFNSAALVRWNSRKTYLRELEAKGANLIPTLWLDAAPPERAVSAFDELGSEDLVFKRQIGAGAADHRKGHLAISRRPCSGHGYYLHVRGRSALWPGRYAERPRRTFAAHGTGAYRTLPLSS